MVLRLFVNLLIFTKSLLAGYGQLLFCHRNQVPCSFSFGVFLYSKSTIEFKVYTLSSIVLLLLYIFLRIMIERVL